MLHYVIVLAIVRTEFLFASGFEKYNVGNVIRGEAKMLLNDPMKSFLDSFSARGRELFLCCVDISFDEPITNML